jgi:hypothetical protein
MDSVSRLCLVWLGLLWSSESTDILTTALARAQGAIESVPLSAALINEGGMPLFVSLKLALVAAGAVALLLALQWIRHRRPGAGLLYAFTLTSIRITTVALALVSLHNAVLITSL